jgi:DHA1 family bicyclomycin/chloramphenicol resistance-like MFS transporter
MKHIGIVVILGTLMGFAPMAIDMYLPALPTLERHFEASPAEVQLTLAAFFIGFALGQAFYGPVADRFGRRPPLLFGLVLFFAASLACAFVDSIAVLIALRFAEAIGAAANVVIVRAMVRDLYEPRQAIKVYSLLTLVFGVAPVLAPLIGGAILVSFGWREIFIALAVFGFISLAATVLRLPESLPPGTSQPLRLGPVLRTYVHLLSQRHYLGCVFAGAFSLAGLFAYIAGSPFVVIELYGVAPEDYGWLFGANALGLVLAAQLNARLVRRRSPETLLLAGVAIQAFAGVLLAIQSETGTLDLYGVAVPLFAYVSGIGIVMPNATALAMAPYGRTAGAASALLGTLQFGLSAAAATIVGAAHDGTGLPMAAVIAACGLVTLAIGFRLSRAPMALDVPHP